MTCKLCITGIFPFFFVIKMYFVYLYFAYVFNYLRLFSLKYSINRPLICFFPKQHVSLRKQIHSFIIADCAARYKDQLKMGTLYFSIHHLPITYILSYYFLKCNRLIFRYKFLAGIGQAI